MHQRIWAHEGSATADTGWALVTGVTRPCGSVGFCTLPTEIEIVVSSNRICTVSADFDGMMHSDTFRKNG